MVEKSLKNKYLLKNTIIIAIGNFGSKLITFFLVPLYTNVLTTNEYGTIDIITIIGTVIMPLVTLNIQEAVMRYCMDKNANKEKILSIGVLILFFSMVIIIALCPVFFRVDIIQNYSILLAFYIFSFASSSIFLCYIRGTEKLLDYSIISMVQTLCIAALNILFLVYFNLGIKGYILAYIISYALTIVLCFLRGNIFSILKRSKIDKKLAKDMIKYSIILIPNSLMWWIMNSLDRVMIMKMINLELNGIYAVSYKIPSIMITLTTIFNQAWMFSAVKEKESIDKNAYTNTVYTALFNIVILISISLILILKPLMKVYVGKEFQSAWLYTPPLILGTVFMTMGTFISNEYTANKDSLGFLKSSSIGAIINVILNFILIPIIGVLGASIATCFSYICVYIFRVFDTKKYVNLNILDKVKIWEFLLLIISSIVVYINSNFIYLFILIILIIYIFITRRFWINIIDSIKNKILKKKVKT